MKRRTFIGAASAAAAGWSCASASPVVNATPEAPSVTDGGMLAGKTLDKLREEHRYWLFDDYLSFHDRFCVDREFGGFTTSLDRDGTKINTNKNAWFEGRGIWVMSYLYNSVRNDPDYVNVARMSVDFIMKHNPLGPELLPSQFTREGEPLTGPAQIFYGDMFVANGLQEFSQASGEDQYWDMAKKIILKCLDIYDHRPNYGNLPKTETSPEVVSPRKLGHWFVLLRSTTQMLEKRDDPELKAINDRAVEAVMDYHYNPAYDLINENINHDMSRIESAHGQLVVGHAPETLWMVLFEALRRKDKALFDRAADLLRRHIEVMWDDVYGGLMLGITHVDKSVWNTGKALWLQEEILIGTMCVIEHTGAQWAKDWFSKMYTYVLEKFPLRQYGHPLWILYADRFVTYREHTSRLGNFHHPRQLMINMNALDRMIERGGKVSGHFG